MKRALITTIAVVYFVGYGTISNEMHQLTSCKKEYTYIDVNGNTGHSKHCFRDNDTFICRNIKRGVRAVKVEEKRICK